MINDCKDKHEIKKLSGFQQSLENRGEFTITFELVPSRGGRNREHDRTLDFARQLAADKRIQAVSITDNAGGHPALSPEVLGLEILETGLDVISHFSCKDKNRNEMEGQLFGWDRRGLHNLLVISGDYPKKGYCGHPKPVYDLDSVHVVHMLTLMNSDHYINKSTHPTCFYKGVAVSPFKLTEAEQRMQYYKLHRKISAGADYVITQLGFDARKYHEVLLYMKQNDITVPLLGSVFIPSLGLLEILYKGGVPGCIIPEKVYQEFRKGHAASDKGKKYRLDWAAKLIAVLKGIGYSGAHIGGPGLTMDDFDFMLTEAKHYEGDWQALTRELKSWPEGGYYYFREDKTNGLNGTAVKPQSQYDSFRPVYAFAKFTHNMSFDRKGSLYKLCKSTCLAAHNSPFKGAAAALEHLGKFVLFNCQNCGDCTLSSFEYLCPQSGCAKYMLNGPCGGSRDGWCEVYPDVKRCLFVKAYERSTSSKTGAQFKQGFEPPRNWELNNSSSWLNFYQGTDNRRKKE